MACAARPSASPGKVTATTAAPAVAPAAADPVELLAPGSEPRAPLRYAARVGTREETVIRTQTELQGPPSSSGAALPPALVLAELELAAVKDDGRLEYEVMVGSVPTLAQPAQLMAKGHLRVDSRGIAVELALPRGAPDEADSLSPPVGIVRVVKHEPDWQMGPTVDFDGRDLRAATDGPLLLGLDNLVVPLPEAPVGLGAKWGVTNSSIEDGVRFEVRTEYELLAWRPAGAEVRATSSLALAPGSTAASDGQAHVAEAEASASARYTVLFDRVLAVGRAELGARTVVTQGGETPESAALTMRRRQVIEVEPFGAQGLSAFPSWSILNVPQARWWQVNYCSTLHGERNGTFETPGGQGAQGRCVHGKPEGPWRSNVEEAGPLSGEFADGRPTGIWVQQGSDQERVGQYELHEGSGTVVAWWPGGQKRLEAELRDGKPDGRFATWYENGKPHLQGAFSAGEKRGCWSERDPSGTERARWLIDRGCRIVDYVVPGCPAARVGIRPGDLVLAAGPTAVESGEGVRLAVQAAGRHPLKLSLDRQGKPVNVRLSPATTGSGRPRIGVVFACHVLQPGPCAP